MQDQTIYFPTFFDFRGRIYPSPNYLSYQSNDLARSLLLFKNINTNLIKTDNIYNEIFNNILNDDIYSNNEKNKEKIKDIKLKDIDYFKLYFANTFGKSKLTRKGKLKWFNNYINDIINTYKKDLELFKNNYLFESKEPFQFLSCIISYYNYITYNNEIKIPILFDASCSGIQHLSALTTDIKIASLVNLLDNDEPSDFYEYCLNQISEVIKLIAEDGNKKVVKDKLMQININRKWLKHCIMTVPYNVTAMGLLDKLMKHFKIIELDNEIFDKLESGEINLQKIIEEFKEMENNNIISILSDSSEGTLQLNDKDLDKDQEKLNKSKYRATKTILIPYKELLINKNNQNLYFTRSELFIFADLIKLTVLNVIPPFNQLKNYFDKIIEVMKKIDMPIF